MCRSDHLHPILLGEFAHRLLVMTEYGLERLFRLPFRMLPRKLAHPFERKHTLCV